MGSVDIVLGLQWGDEGKGTTVNWRAKELDNAMVVRFGGGSQCGHTVCHNGIRHEFASVGSGAFQGTSTYISQFCTISPIALMNEILTLGFVPKIYINMEAMVVMPVDAAYDKRENDGKFATTFRGMGVTIKRNLEHRHLYFRDLLYPFVREVKETEINRWYKETLGVNMTLEEEFNYNAAVEYLIKHCTFVDSLDDIYDYDNLIFEGHQGIMLDQHYGFFPDVTRSNTTAANALEILKESRKHHGTPNTYYVMRAYGSRHGHGKYPYRGIPVTPFIKLNPNETNVKNASQGEFIMHYHSSESLRYAIACDSYKNSVGLKHLVVTCLDQTEDKVLIDKKIIPIEMMDWSSLISMDGLHFSRSEEGSFDENQLI